LCGVWRVYCRNPAFERRLEATIDELRAAGIRVVIMLDTACHPEDVPLQLARRAYAGLPTDDVGIPLAEHRARNRSCDASIIRAARGKATVFDPIAALMDDRGLCRAEMDGDVLYRDNAHLSVEGGLRLRGLFEAMFDSLALSPLPREEGNGARTVTRAVDRRRDQVPSPAAR
jgi:hypothetical protein